MILDTGVNVTGQTEPFLCKDGHRSFLSNRKWDEDKIGHGTTIVKVITERLDPKKSCIVVFKTSGKGFESDARAKAYATALVNLASVNFNVLLLAFEDVSYFHKEAEWLDALLVKSKVQIVAAAGNSGEQLRENNHCKVYPACLRSKLLKKERFDIVGSTEGKFNQGKALTARRPSSFDDENGTSISAARFASELMD